MDTFTILDETISQLIIGDEPTHINFYNSFDVQEEFENIENQKSFRFILGEDFEPFDFVLDTDNLSADEVFEVLCKVIDNVFLSVPRV